VAKCLGGFDQKKCKEKMMFGGQQTPKSLNAALKTNETAKGTVREWWILRLVAGTEFSI